jgi:CheY-like chemotaxis protein
VELRREPTELSAVMRSAIEAAHDIISAAGHRLEMQPPAPSVVLDADPTRLTQILTNLLNNAAKYTPDGGHIWFDARVVDERVAISVRDSGIGIAADNLANVFTMFAQLEPALTRSQGGLGIGLALVKGLVTLHGGTIEVASAGVGQGSEFTVWLPVLHTSGVPALAPPAQAQPDAPARKKVLVVDDNHDGADMLRMALDMLGHDVRCAYDGASAIAEATAFYPDVIVLDIGLPDMDGYAVARAMRRHPASQNALLIAATGWGQQSDRDAAREAGFDAHLVKPVDFTELAGLMERERGSVALT